MNVACDYEAPMQMLTTEKYIAAGPGARTRDLSRARRGSPAAHQGGGCLDKQDLSVPRDRVGRLRNTVCCVFWR